MMSKPMEHQNRTGDATFEFRTAAVLMAMQDLSATVDIMHQVSAEFRDPGYLVVMDRFFKFFNRVAQISNNNTQWHPTYFIIWPDASTGDNFTNTVGALDLNFPLHSDIYWIHEDCDNQTTIWETY